MFPDDLCPECNAESPEDCLARPDRIVRRCRECGHRWNEAREAPIVRRGGWVFRDGAEVPTFDPNGGDA
jgi:hypothetical protein